MKKKILGLLLMTGSVVSSRAQKGTVLVYGVGGIHKEKGPNDDRTTVFTISPGVGYQFTGNWAAGIAGSYGRQNFKPETGAENRTNTYKLGGFTRYTHTFNTIFSLYGQGDVYCQSGKTQEIRSNGWGISIVPTVGINVSNGFALNVSFGGISYETSKVKHADHGTETFDLNFGQQVGIGISKNFGRKDKGLE